MTLISPFVIHSQFICNDTSLCLLTQQSLKIVVWINKWLGYSLVLSSLSLWQCYLSWSRLLLIKTISDQSMIDVELRGQWCSDRILFSAGRGIRNHLNRLVKIQRMSNENIATNGSTVPGQPTNRRPALMVWFNFQVQVTWAVWESSVRQFN